jgi:hypothetical protein
MSGANSPEILAAYEDVRSDKNDTNWLIISYANATGEALALTATGTGGLEERSYYASLVLFLLTTKPKHANYTSKNSNALKQSQFL